MRLHISSTLLGLVNGHVRGNTTEQVAFLFVKQMDADIAAVDSYLVPPRELVHESRFHAEVSEEAQAKIIKSAADRGLMLVEIHSHPGCKLGVEFSSSDLAGFRDFVPHVFWRLRMRRYAALVFGDEDFDALAWIDDANEPVAFEGLVVNGHQVQPTGITIRELERQKREAERYCRQIAVFGKDGQNRLGAKSVAIVGVGGLGCHVVQQLAYAGVKRYFLIDPDRVDRSNLNRFVLATEADLGSLKVMVARDYILRVQPDADVQIVAAPLTTVGGFDACSKAEFVFGCMDNDGPRLVLLEICCSQRKPYLDLASDVPGPGSFGGRIVFTGLGKGCLSCREELDQKEVWRYFASPEQRAEDDKIYGIDRSALGESGPSVVFLNGVIASLAVTEFVAFVTGIRAPLPQLNYRGELGIVTTAKASSAGCYYCGQIWNRLSEANLTRYLASAEVEVSHKGDRSL